MSDFRAAILQKALTTRDPDKLFSLLEEALEHGTFLASKLAFTEKREADLKAQVARQTAMIENLEKTLWNRKK